MGIWQSPHPVCKPNGDLAESTSSLHTKYLKVKDNDEYLVLIDIWVYSVFLQARTVVLHWMNQSAIVLNVPRFPFYFCFFNFFKEFIYLFIYLSIYLFIHLFVYLFIYLLLRDPEEPCVALMPPFKEGWARSWGQSMPLRNMLWGKTSSLS